MARFRYRAVAASGDLIEGEMEAASEAKLLEQLRSQGHLPLRAETLAEGAAPVAASGGSLGERLRQPLFGSGRIGRTEVAIMTRELATLLDAGLTLDQSLRVLIDQVESEALRRLLAQMLEQIQGGSTLADALAQHEGVFSRAYISMVRAGEAGGSLDDVLGRLAEFLDGAEALAEQVKSALVYPILVLIIAGASIMILLTVVLPQFTPLFESAGAELPTLTKVVLTLGELTQRYWWAMLLALAAGIWLLRRMMARPASRARIDALTLRLPLFGPLFAKLDTARMARTLGTLLGNGVPLLQALSIVEQTLGNAVLRQAIADAAIEVKEGRGLATSLSRTERFPKLALHLLAVGERSGRLEPMLMKIAELFDRDVRSTIERLMALLVPLLTIGLGVVIALIIGAIMMAILSAYQLPL
jgi:general secretion pathway protein F